MSGSIHPSLMKIPDFDLPDLFVAYEYSLLKETFSEICLIFCTYVCTLNQITLAITPIWANVVRRLSLKYLMMCVLKYLSSQNKHFYNINTKENLILFPLYSQFF